MTKQNVCPRCGAPFTGPARKIYCSKACAWRAWRAANRDLAAQQALALKGLSIDGRLLRVKDAAKMIGVSPSTIRRWLRKGAIAAVKPGLRSLHYRIPESEIQRILSAEPQIQRILSRGRNPET